jgi:hypothetical protein
MEDIASGIDRVLLAKLVGLARRGAFLHKQCDGAALVLPKRGSDGAAVALNSVELVRSLAAGWIAPAGAERLQLTRRGLALVRRAKSPAALEIGRTGVSGPSETLTAKARPTVNRDESPLSWLRRRTDKHGRPLISATEYEAGERLRADFWLAQLTPRVTASWSKTAPVRRHRRSAPSADRDLADHVIAARERVRRALGAVGPELAGVLIDVCGHLQGLEQVERAAGWPQRAGKVILQLALQRLARHYGIEPEASIAGPSRIRHWGADGYRPALDGAEAEDGRSA